MRSLLLATFLVASTALVACSDPATTKVGDLQTLSTREARLMGKLSQADAELLARIRRAQQTFGAAATDLLPGTTTTWAAFNDLMVEQALVVSRQWGAKQDELRQLAAAKARADAEKVAADKKRTEEERLAAEEAKRRGPHPVPDTAALMADQEGFSMYCNQDREPEDEAAPLPWKEWKKTVDLQMWTTSEFLIFTPVTDRLALVKPKDESHSIDGFFYYSERGHSIFQDGKLVLVKNWNADGPTSRAISAYFDKFRSSEVIAVSTIPAADDSTKDVVTYRFNLEGTSQGQPKKVEMLCKALRSNPTAVKGRAERVAAAKASEAARPRSPNELLVERIEAKGGNCAIVGDHLRVHLQRAEQNGDWSGFQEELGRGASYGC